MLYDLYFYGQEWLQEKQVQLIYATGSKILRPERRVVFEGPSGSVEYDEWLGEWVERSYRTSFDSY